MSNAVRWDDFFEDASFGLLEGVPLRVKLQPSGLWRAEIGGREVHFPTATNSRDQAKAWCLEAALKLQSQPGAELERASGHNSTDRSSSSS